MSAHAHPLPAMPRRADLLGELLHSLSQPLTSLQCSLELSLDRSLERSLQRSLERSVDHSAWEAVEQQQESVAAALEHTAKVIGMIQLMREYLDAERPGPKSCCTALEPALRSVIEDLSSIAAVRGVRLRLTGTLTRPTAGTTTGTTTATLAVPESRLRLALQYLITPLIEEQPAGGSVALLLGDSPAGAVLRVEGKRGFRAVSGSTSTFRKVQLAIAGRVFEMAGAGLSLGDAGSAGFVLRIPSWGVASA